MPSMPPMLSIPVGWPCQADRGRCVRWVAINSSKELLFFQAFAHEFLAFLTLLADPFLIALLHFFLLSHVG